MRIGELAARCGLSIETIRFYESKGMLPAPLRLANNYRDYSDKHLARLHFIRHCRLLDMSLEEIARLISISKGEAGEFDYVHETVNAHIEAIDKRICELNELKKKLIELQKHCSGAHDHERCGILDKLEAYDAARCCCGAKKRE